MLQCGALWCGMRRHSAFAMVYTSKFRDLKYALLSARAKPEQCIKI